MKMTSHTVKVPTWRQSEYGEPTPTWSVPVTIPMFIGWTSAMRNTIEGTIYEQYEFVGLTKHNVQDGSLIDDKYVVGYVERSGRFKRVFMNYAEGVDRTYEQRQGDSK